jgi:hypothetical protein
MLSEYPWPLLVSARPNNPGRAWWLDARTAFVRPSFEVCYEASCGYGHYHDLLCPIAARVTVAHSGRLRLIFRSKDKNDRKDAERLVKLLYLGEAPAVHVPAADVRTWRELITCRGRVIAKRTRAENYVRTLLRCAGVVPPSRPVLWTKKGLEWLRRLGLPTESQGLRQDLLLEEVEALSRQAERIEVHLNQQAKHSPAVLLLRSIPGCRNCRPEPRPYGRPRARTDSLPRIQATPYRPIVVSSQAAVKLEPTSDESTFAPIFSLPAPFRDPNHCECQPPRPAQR